MKRGKNYARKKGIQLVKLLPRLLEWRYFGGGTAAENLRAYLYKAVRNKCVDYLRFRKKRVPLEDLDGELVASESENAETSLLRNENKKAVYQALQSLPSQYREVLYLTYYEDYEAEEIARILRKTKKQIYNLLHRAKLSLKNLLVKEGISHENL